MSHALQASYPALIEVERKARELYRKLQVHAGVHHQQQKRRPHLDAVPGTRAAHQVRSRRRDVPNSPASFPYPAAPSPLTGAATRNNFTVEREKYAESEYGHEQHERAWTTEQIQQPGA